MLFRERGACHEHAPHHTGPSSVRRRTRAPRLRRSQIQQPALQLLAGAQQAHNHGLWDSVKAVPQITLAKAKILGGFAVVENAFRQALLIDVVPLDVDLHVEALALMARYGFSIYDSLIVAAALSANCTTLHSEDLQHGQVIDGRLTVRNPFS